MMLTQFDRNYLTLALEIDKHIDGYVDAYFGPPEIKETVAASAIRRVETLLEDCAWLKANIPAENSQRALYLGAALRSFNCTLSMLAGETVDYLDEVHALYDIQPTMVDEALFTAAAGELDTLLTGNGSLSERLKAHRAQFEVSAEKALPALDIARQETRRRTVELVDLIDGENFELTLVNDKPWSAYNWFKGNAQSLVEFNTDLPLSAMSLTMTMAHEAYPGHHTELQIKEKHLYQTQGFAEFAVMLLHSPASVIAEGIATVAANIIFPNGSIYEWTLEKLLPLLDITIEQSADELRTISRSAAKLSGVNRNAAILLHSGKLTEAQAIDYLITYSHTTEKRAKQGMRFMTHPLYRSYLFTYTEGKRLFEDAAKNHDRNGLFLRLLHEPILPSTLATM